LESDIEFLRTGKETVLSFLYNSLRYLVAARKLEQNKAHFVATDQHMNEIVHKGVAFRRIHLKQMIEAQLERYDSAVRVGVLYGEEVEEGVVFPVVDIGSLMDDLNNRGRGYTFLNDPANRLESYKATYAQWLLADPTRRDMWKSTDGKIRRGPAKAWLKIIASIEVSLAVGVLLSCGPSPRNTEFVRQLIRQEVDANRSLMVLFHCLSLTAVNDKNSHQHRQDKFIPHVPSRSWAIRVVQHMATLRPFAEFLITRVLYPKDEKIQHRYHIQLWPTLTGTMSHHAFANEMARITHLHLKVAIRVKQWRQLTTLFAHLIQEQVSFKYPKNLLVDTLNMHSTATGNSKYGGSGVLFSGSDPRMLACLVEASLVWHQLIDLDQDEPLVCGSGPQELPVASAGSGNVDLGPLVEQFEKMKNVLWAMQESNKRMIEQAVAEAFVMHRPMSADGHPDNAPVAPPSAAILPQPALLHHFRLFIRDPAATFRTAGQAQLIALGHANADNVLAVIRTSSGKTAATIFLASLSPLVTVVVVPLIALRDNILDDAARYGVRASQFVGEMETDTAVRILVVALEHLEKNPFE